MIRHQHVQISGKGRLTLQRGEFHLKVAKNQIIYHQIITPFVH
jgi:hypothetical protein